MTLSGLINLWLWPPCLRSTLAFIGCRKAMRYYRNRKLSFVKYKDLIESEASAVNIEADE